MLSQHFSSLSAFPHLGDWKIHRLRVYVDLKSFITPPIQKSTLLAQNVYYPFSSRILGVLATN